MIATSFTCRSVTDLQCPDCRNYYDSLAHPGYTFKTRYTCFDKVTICPNCAEMHGYTQCDDCNSWDDCVEIGIKIVCSKCASDYNWAKCEDCGKWFEEDDLVDCDGDRVCVDCAGESGFSCCEDCGEWTKEIVGCNGTFYCEGCANNHGWALCTSCEVWSSNTINNEGGDTYCCNCYSDCYTSCEECNCEIEVDNACYDENAGCTLCEHCYGHRSGNEEWEPEHFTNTTGYFGSTRKFGIELETHRCSDHAGFRGNRAWGAKHDGSISGKEFVSSILSGNSGLTAIDDLCAYADDNGWTVNRDCGFHLHFDVSDESTESRVSITGAALATYEVWKKFVDSKRHTNHYCDKTSYTFNDLKARGIPSYTTRFTWFNVEAYPKHHTFEVRLHEGTLDATTVKNWTIAWTVFADWAAKKSIIEIEREFANLSITQKFYKLCKIWKGAGCNDLVDYYSKKGGFDPPASFEDKITEIRSLMIARCSR